MSQIKYTLDYIVKENGKYYAHLREHDPNGTSKAVHSASMYGWNGWTYKEMQNILQNYDISLPPLKNLTLFKKTQCRKCYVVDIDTLPY